MGAAHQNQRNFRDIGTNEQDDKHQGDHGQSLTGDVLELRLGDAAGHEEVYTHGRRDEADGKVDHNDDAEVQRRYAHARHDGQQDGHEDNDGRQRFHERADDEQEHVDEHQDDDLVLGEAQDGPGHSAGHVFDGHDVPEQGRHGHQHDNDGGSLAGLNARVDKALEIHFLIQEQAHDQTVEGGDGRGFGRGHDAAVDAAEHDDRNHERPLGVPSRVHEGPCIADLFLTAPPLLAGIPIAVAHKHDAHHDAGHDTAHEQVADGDLRGNAVHHKGVARGDHDAHATGGRNEGCGKILVVTALHHRGDGERADGRHGGGAGTGDRAEEAGYDDTHIRNAAFSVTDTGVNETDQARGNSRLRHDISG